jgi:hypothetical protein
MKSDIKIIEEEHVITSDQKLKWLGYGEWVEEVDRLKFEYLGYDCMIHRVFQREPYAKQEYYFGGHLCGYVKLPEYHPYYSLECWDMDIECHGGLTYGEKHPEYWIGFDCGHSFDVVPSVEFTKYLDKDIQDLKRKFNLGHSKLFERTYRNMEYVKEQCIQIVDQLKNIAFTAMTEAAAESLKEAEDETSN